MHDLRQMLSKGTKQFPPRFCQCNNDSDKKNDVWGLTFAVGIWTAIDGVGSSPGAEGCMVGGCIGLKAPFENVKMKTKSGGK